MYSRALAAQIGGDEMAAAAAAGSPAAAAAAADIFSARPDLFPPIGAIEFYRYFVAVTPSQAPLYQAGTTIAIPNRLIMLIPAGFRFRVFKFGTMRAPLPSADPTQAGWPDAETCITTGNIDPTELTLDGSPVSGTRILFDDGALSQTGQAHDVYVRGRGPVQIAVRISKNPLSIPWGTNGAWYRGWMWQDPK